MRDGRVCALQVDKADLCKLCVHKLPAGSNGGSLEAVAAAVKSTLAAACRQAGSDAEAAAVESAAVEQPNDNSKQLLFLVFKHAGMANDVFAALPGAFLDVGCNPASPVRTAPAVSSRAPAVIRQESPQTT